MTTAIVYYSKHHGNTKKLLDAIVDSDASVVLIDVTEQPDADLSVFDRIGFASGIYFGAFAKQIISFAEAHLPENKAVFYIYTYGVSAGNVQKEIREIAEKNHCRELGSYHCLGFDTFGPFKLVGGIAKGHPTAEEIAGAVNFYQAL
ncbi:MAG: flavodoxin domain-containing protein [Eubacteriales bacterium]|jgi:menaquinone-dependent protoporphyrinogen IX oxidase